MALINSEITPRSYEIIRDQLAAIVASELIEQAAITYDDLFLAPVYLQRAKNISVEECPLVNIAVDSGKYNNQTIIDSDGEYTFFIDVFTTSTYTTTKRGDELSSKEAQRLAGVIQGILSNPQYVTLGFARPFIMRSKVVGFEPGTITKDESTNLAVVRITLSVKAIQNELVQQPISEFEISTQVFLYETEQGYLYSGVGAPLPPPSPTCEPVTVYDTDGNLLGTKESGGYFIVDDSTVILINSLDEEISQTPILATATKQITAPNANYRVLDQNATVLATGSIPSNDNQDVIITITNKTYSITDTDGNVLYSGTVTVDLVKAIQDATVTNSDSSFTASILAEGNAVLPDITVNVKNSLGATLNTVTSPSVIDVDIESPDITFTDSDGSVSSVPAGVDITASSCPPPVTPTYATAELMRTGQTTSYRTGDDGDLEKGRSVNFFTLLSPNPFGNTNRFTDELGGQSYVKNIAIDWSTYNGSTVLGYYRRLLNTGGVTYDFNWNDAIDKALAHSVTGFTSGWRLWNRDECANIMNLEYSNAFTPPFDNSSGGQLETQNMWTSTTLKISTSQAWFTVYYGNFDYGGKTGNRRVVAVRNFTVTGTTLS